MSAALKPHPYADKYPMLSDGELAELAESIKANGLRQPIVITPDGQILDGRNRYAACQQAGVEPQVETYDGDDLAEYVIDCNSSRRHMSTGARAMADALVLQADNKRADGKWRYGELHGSVQSGPRGYRSRLNEAGVVLDYSPDLAEQVVNGDLALDAALRQAEQVRDAERLRLKEEERIQAEEEEAAAALPQEYADLVGTKYSSARVAFAAWEDDNKAEAAKKRREKEEKQRKAAAEKKARIDLHTQILTAIGSVASFGRYEDMTVLVADYKPDDLPRHLVRDLTVENLDAASRFIEYLKTWKAQS